MNQEILEKVLGIIGKLTKKQFIMPTW